MLAPAKDSGHYPANPAQRFLNREKAIAALLWINKVYGTPVHAIVEKLRAATD